MVTTPLDMKYAYKRGRSLERRKSINESARIPDLSGNMSDDFYRYKVEAFTRDCVDYKNAIDLLETLYTNNKFDLLESSTQRIMNDVIPCVESEKLPDCISYIESKDIGDINRDRLIETAKMYKSIDRIVKNHKNLTKRFNMNFKGKSDKEKCYRVCEMVNTYKSSPNVKFNICLEELTYLGYINDDKISDKSIVENVSKYFLMMDDNIGSDISNYTDSIRNSKVLSEGADSNVRFLTSPSSDNIENKYKVNDWKDTINEWLVDPCKDINTLAELARNNLDNIYALNTILEYVDDYCRINESSFNTMDIFTGINTSVSGVAAHNIINIIEENNISDASELVDNMTTIWEAEVNDEVYADGTTKPETFTSDEIDKFQLQNMIDDARVVGEFLDQLEKSSMKESPLKIDRVISASDEDLNESNIIDHTDADGYITMKIRSYIYEGRIENIYDMLESTRSCINNILYNSKSKMYYNISENHFDIYLRSKYKLVLSEAQEFSRGFVNSDKQIICDIHNKVDSYDGLMESSIGVITSVLENTSYAATVTVPEASLVFEMMAPYLSKDTINEFLELCRSEANPHYDFIKRNLSSYTEETIDPYTDHESVFRLVLQTMSLNEGVASNIKSAVGDLTKPIGNKNKKVNNKSSDGKNDSKMEDDQKPSYDDKSRNDDRGADSKRAINSINDARLVWQGIKSKMKGASAKEQEMSRDLDMEFNHLLRTMKATYGTDHREEIITGEVNHSISKIIKIGIALAGIGAVTSNFVIPIIGAVAIFARSKYLTLKEKKLILDEIDIELQVIEREISRAEQSGSTKKYRQLLTIQKNMQRRRQEIYYDLARKGNRIPMASTKGLRERE